MILKNSRHELFAQAVASGKTPSDAYALAGFEPSSANACRLLTRDSVRQRVNEIQSAMAARAVKQAYYTREWVVEQLIDNVMRAKHAADFSAANSALRLLGVERAMFIDRKETGSPGDFAGLNDTADVMALVREQIGEEAAAILMTALARRGEPAQESKPELAPIARDPGETLN